MSFQGKQGREPRGQDLVPFTKSCACLAERARRVECCGSGQMAACSRCTLEGGFRSSQVEHLFSHETGVPSAGNATRTLG
jgi:hypothetical protein